jgi:hypothetical protein
MQLAKKFAGKRLKISFRATLYNEKTLTGGTLQ